MSEEQNPQGKTTIRQFIQKEWKYMIGLALVLALLVFGYVEYQQWKQHIINQSQKDTRPVMNVTTTGAAAKPDDLKTVYLQGQNTHTKEIVYVSKEVDPKTNQPEKTDIQFERKNSKVYVKVNGKEFEIPTDVKEDAKFENGKLVITEETEMRINVVTPKPVMTLGLGYGRNGTAVKVSGPLSGAVGWWIYGDKQTVAGGLQFPILK